MNVIIIEDEAPAAEKLERYINRYDKGIQVLKILSSITSSVNWLKQNAATVDLIFMDIQLSDGLSFSIFEEIQISKPIIFTTAYDEYAIKAFEVNSIAYLLKPIVFTDLGAALKKWEKIKEENVQGSVKNFKKLLEEISHKKQYKSRFMVKIGGHIRSITINQILYFYAEGRNAYITIDQGRNLIIDYKLEELETLLDPKLFFRVNRTYIMHINAINEVLVHSNSRLKIITQNNPHEDVIISREKVGLFKQWFAGE